MKNELKKVVADQKYFMVFFAENLHATVLMTDCCRQHKRPYL
jgi:hypothetical protein